MKSIKANSGVVYEKGYVMIFIYFFYFLSELCGIGNIAYYMLYPGSIIAFLKAPSYSVNHPALCCKLLTYSFSDPRRRPGYNCFFHLITPL